MERKRRGKKVNILWWVVLLDLSVTTAYTRMQSSSYKKRVASQLSKISIKKLFEAHASSLSFIKFNFTISTYKSHYLKYELSFITSDTERNHSSVNAHRGLEDNSVFQEGFGVDL